MDSMERPDSSRDLSQASSMTRTLVRGADGTLALSQAMADGVQDDLALRGELAHALSPADACAGDQAVQAGEVELELLELELGRGGLELACADDELGDEAGEWLVARRERCGGGAQ